MEQERDTRLGNFTDWLRQRRLAPENRIPYLVCWVERFLRLSASRSREAWQDTLRVFLEDLGQGETPDWQIRQAADAVSLYCGQFQRVPGVLTGMPPVIHTTLWDPPAALREMEDLLRLRHYSPRTQRSYLGWVRRYSQYLGRKRSTPLTPEDAKAYLSHLATRRKVSASTQNQAFNAILFLYRHVLRTQLGDMTATLRARRGQKLPVVLSTDEVRAILGQLRGTRRIMIELIYGGGLRLSELVLLRVKDIDFDAGTVTVRSGKGDKDRVTLLPQRTQSSLRTCGCILTPPP